MTKDISFKFNVNGKEKTITIDKELVKEMKEIYGDRFHEQIEKFRSAIEKI